MEKYETLEQALKDLNWLKIDSEEELINYFNPNNLDEEGVPEITAKEKTIIVCDNKDWNSNYVIDLVANTVKNQNINCKLVYINDINLRLFVEKINLTESDKEEFDFIIEREKLHPMVIVINPEKNVIVRMQESNLTIIRDFHVETIVQWLDNKFCDKNI